MRETKKEASSWRSILASARELFTVNGYEATSVDSILLGCGLSKGTFYHYFESKSGLLDAVVDELLEEVVGNAARILDDTTLSPGEKLDRFLAAGRSWRLAHARTVGEVARVVLEDQNALLREKMRARSSRIVLPVLARIIAEGVAKGEFSIPHPDPGETAALIMHLADGCGDANYRELLGTGEETGCLERVKNRADACFTAIERILGISSGTLSRLDPAFLSGLVQALHPLDASEVRLSKEKGGHRGYPSTTEE